jgi:GNAT superfamily N-acetyltransferase
VKSNDFDLLSTYGLSACAAIREIVLPHQNKVKTSENDDMFILICDDEMGKKANLLCKIQNLKEHIGLLKIMYVDASFFLCERSIKLDDYISCEKINYGFYYKFKAEDFKDNTLHATSAPVMQHIDEVKSLFIDQKKVSTLNDIEKWLLEKNLTICLVKESVLLGVIVLSKYRGNFFINLMYVHEQYRDHGVGTELLKHAAISVLQEGNDYFFGMSPYNVRRFYKTLSVIDTEGWVLWKKKN